MLAKVLQIVGALSVVVGLAMVSPAAACVGFGVFALLFGIAAEGMKGRG